MGRQSNPALSVSTDKLHFQAAGARKALATKWTTLSTPASLPNMMFGSNASDQSMLNPETPSKSLLGTDTSNSMLFSPPSILKVTNSQLSLCLRKSVFITTYLWSLSPLTARVTPLSFTMKLLTVSVLLQETLPEEAGQNNPLLPCNSSMEEASPTSKVSPQLGHIIKVIWSDIILIFQLDVRWNMIACGKTRPSIDMTEHARQYLSGIKPRSLNL